VLKALDKVIHIGDRVFVSICVVLLMVLVLTVTAGVISRYFFNAPFDWTEELVTLIFIYISFLGAAVASVRHKHVAVDFMTAKATSFTKGMITIIADVLTLVFLVMVVIGSIILIPSMMNHASVALNIPRSVYYFAILGSSLLISLTHITSLIRGIDALVLHKAGKEESR
jgi:TRAP-type C4-dicarboxylate transport system permease small subunit